VNRSTLFYAGLAVGLVCLIIAVMYLAGAAGLGKHIKHALLFFGLAVVAFVFAAVNRPLGSRI
jgi:hypothetical protein